jgi:hypothetical protein
LTIFQKKSNKKGKTEEDVKGLIDLWESEKHQIKKDKIVIDVMEYVSKRG